MGVPQNQLINDVPTRWNSTFDMFERLLQQLLPIYNVLHDARVTKPADARTLALTDAQWGIIENLVPVLKPLYIATRVMCSEEYPTVSGVYPIIYSIIKHHMAVSDTDTPSVRKFKDFIRNDMTARFKLNSESTFRSTTMLATFLDPRYRSPQFLTPVQRQTVIDEAETETRRLFDMMTSGDTSKSNVTEPETDDASANSAQNDPGYVPCKRGRLEQEDMQFLLGEFFEPDCEVITPTDISSKISLYKADRAVASKTNPFKWWS